MYCKVNYFRASAKTSIFLPNLHSLRLRVKKESCSSNFQHRSKVYLKPETSKADDT